MAIIQRNVSSPIPNVLRQSLWILAFMSPLAATEWAQAAPLCGTVQCPTGYTCQTPTASQGMATQGTSFDVATSAATAPAPFCAPASCTTDADCGTHMLCREGTVSDCVTALVPPCAPGADCIATPTPPSDCSARTVRECVPRWELPCQTASDCGAGFACEEKESCACSGSAAAKPADLGSGSDSADGKDAAPPPPDSSSCGCKPSGTFACNPVSTPCSKDSDCLTDWTCDAQATGGTCWVTSTGESGCDTTPVQRYCQPPFSRLRGQQQVLDASNSGSVTAPANPPSGQGVGATAASGGSTNSSDETNPSKPTGETGDDTAKPGEATAKPVTPLATPEEIGGCAVTSIPRGTHSGLMLLALGFAGIVGLRRRNRAA